MRPVMALGAACLAWWLAKPCWVISWRDRTWYTEHRWLWDPPDAVNDFGVYEKSTVSAKVSIDLAPHLVGAAAIVAGTIAVLLSLSFVRDKSPAIREAVDRAPDWAKAVGWFAFLCAGLAALLYFESRGR